MKNLLSHKFLKFFLITFTICMAVYSQAIHFSYFILDDAFHIYENDHIQLNLSNILWFWTNSKTPLAYNIWQVIGAVGGVHNTELFRIANIVFHSINSILVYFIISQLSSERERSCKAGIITAMIFAFHPIQVESVVWISSLRGLLAGFFVLLGIWTSINIKFDYKKSVAILILFILGLLSKPTIFLLPIIVMGIDYYHHKKNFKEVLKENGFLILCLIIGVIYFYNDLIIKMTGGGIGSYLKLITFNSIFYFKRIFFLSDFGYEMSGLKDVYNFKLSIWDYLIGIGTLTTLCLSFIFRKRFSKQLGIALVIFLSFYVPISGVLNFHYQIVSVVAERYFYLPLIGLGWLIEILIHKFKPSIRGYISTLMAVTLILASFSQVGKWDSFSVFNHNGSESSFFYNILLGKQQVKEGRLEGAEKSFLRAKKNDPSFIGSNVGLMSVYLRQGSLEKAELLKEEIGELLFEDWTLLSDYISILVENRIFSKANSLMSTNFSRYLYSRQFIVIYRDLLESERRFILQVLKSSVSKNPELEERNRVRILEIDTKIKELEELY
ncbi:putative membrane protein [Halobacteriovorax marinus SJ]|uniref:Membrane protein n=1 Tax=Halobacteriovorax marinus (strain ATCC BAA-682 / DSM 15412 / SJ) TaxID=862908 RepID=E1WZV0_HALMS|nr:glycosyltransferase family 39 protein [Halobacteriovorax marinus]CBW27886.1 putative membrane protein [Halobacteriovorax marinus SJ]